jgi:hypothetical protein
MAEGRLLQELAPSVSKGLRVKGGIGVGGQESFDGQRCASVRECARRKHRTEVREATEGVVTPSGRQIE